MSCGDKGCYFLPIHTGYLKPNKTGEYNILSKYSMELQNGNRKTYTQQIAIKTHFSFKTKDSFYFLPNSASIVPLVSPSSAYLALLANALKMYSLLSRLLFQGKENFVSKTRKIISFVLKEKELVVLVCSV